MKCSNREMCADNAHNISPPPSRPLLRWAGSKRTALPHLLSNLPDRFNRYIEPFAGSAALFFSLSPNKAILSDLNHDLINFYITLRDKPIEIYNSLIAIPRTKEAYIAIREQYKLESSPYNRAVQFVFLNRNCFNGLYRTNKRGEFNVPFAKAGRAAYPTLAEFEDGAKKLEKAKLCCIDFRKILDSEVRAGDFIYLDPPYIKSQGRIFSEYVRGHFAADDMDALDEALKTIDNRGAKFVVSFIDDPSLAKIRSQWNAAGYEVQRNIAGFTTARRKTPEILLRNW